MGRRYLKGDQKLLVDQKLVGAQKLDKEAIQNLYANHPNEKILFLTWSPYVDLYQLGKNSYDTSKYEQKKRKYNLKYGRKIQKAVTTEKTKKEKKLREKLGKKIDKQNINIKEGNLGMRLGEPLAIFDTAKENETLKKVRQYLHSKGYFNATVTYDTEETFKLVTSTYTIDRKEPYIIDSIFYVIQDSAISKIMSKNIEASVIIKGQNYEQENLTKERDRINLLMLDNGYYNFLRRYVNFKVDSSSIGNQKVTVGIQIENPNGLDEHKVFKIDSVIFTTDSDINNITQARLFDEYKGVTYRFHRRRYHEKILDWRLFLYPDSVYSRTNTLETQKQLSNMDIFKFINVNYDTTGGKFIANVFTSRLKKYQTSTETGLSVSQGLPGPFFNASIKNRNTFKGLEITELSGRIGFEGLTGATETSKPYSSLDYGANLSFTFPQFIIPAGDRIKSKLGRFNPKTRISFGLNYNSRIEYLRNNINATWAYTWQNYDKRISHVLNLSEINYINSDVTNSYLDFLKELEEQGNNLIRSFSPSFVSSTSYSATHNINEYGNKKSTSSYLRYRVETGGNIIQSVGRTAFNDLDSIQYFKFAKFNIDFRRTSPLNSNITVAYRINTGVAVPYGANKTLPYEKFYFAGGSNSIRAWEPRRLGPGAFLPVSKETDPTTGEPIINPDTGNEIIRYNNSFEQPGEILLEASVEFRHKLFGPIHGAIFIDAGNVWTIYDDPSRPGSQFEVDTFLKQIAIGAGYGLRVDFSFLILRLDAAWKLSEPGQISKTDSYKHKTFELPDYLPGYQRLVWNLGIGYPF